MTTKTADQQIEELQAENAARVAEIQAASAAQLAQLQAENAALRASANQTVAPTTTQKVLFTELATAKDVGPGGKAVINVRGRPGETVELRSDIAAAWLRRGKCLLAGSEEAKAWKADARLRAAAETRAAESERKARAAADKRASQEQEIAEAAERRAASGNK